MRLSIVGSLMVVWAWLPAAWGQQPFSVSADDEQITIDGPELSAAIRKQGYVSGVAGGSLLDKKTGFRDAGFGLDIVDWIMESGSDKAYRDQLDKELVYEFDNALHGKTAKRSLEGPQICTRAQRLEPTVIEGADFVAVQMSYQYKTAAPGKQTGSKWTQTIVFPSGRRYFISSDRIDSVNSSPTMFLRIDMPGHIRHNRGDTFSEIYLSYVSKPKKILATDFLEDFAPDERFQYRRAEQHPARFIRAYRLRNPRTGAAGPWLAGMTLDPAAVHEAWCHQRGYVCMIEEIGGRPVEAGQSFGAAYIVGFFNSIDDMHAVYDRYQGFRRLNVSEQGWELTR